MTEKQLTIERVKALSGHTDPETAYLVEDYPYGRTLRCQRRTWIETAARGRYRSLQRFVSQTTDPRKLPAVVWNKPHPSVYDMFMVMYLDEHDHVGYWRVGLGVTPAGHARMRLMGLYDQLTETDRARYDALVADSQRYARPWREWAETIDALASHMRTTGDYPELNGEAWQGPGRSYSLADDVASYLVTARRMAEASSPIGDAG